MNDHQNLFMRLRRQVFGNGKSVIVDRRELADALPHYWREERVASPEEWFIRYGRGLGLHITHQIITGNFVVCETIDVAHEATITWP